MAFIKKDIKKSLCKETSWEDYSKLRKVRKKILRKASVKKTS